MRLELAVCLPREAETVALVRSALGETLGAFGVERDCVDDIRLAVSEACSNVIAHARSDDEYEIRIHLDEHNCAIDVLNTGNWLDAASLEGVMPSPHSAHGRGVAIMHAVMDNVTLQSQTAAGTIVHLERALSVRPDSPLSRLRPQA